MDVDHLQDRFYWGLNRTANVLGCETDAYRPIGDSNPIDRPNRYMRLRAAFSRADGNFSQPVGYGIALWRGYFDASYTRVGDYLVQGNDIWFIAAQRSLMPVLCIKANRVISIKRLLDPANGGPDDATVPNSTIAIISRWPASMLGINAEGKPSTHLPGDTTTPNVIALLPSTHEQILRPTDIVTDDQGSHGIIVAAERSDLGWRLNVRQVST
jgi:hypothetical protein